MRFIPALVPGLVLLALTGCPLAPERAAWRSEDKAIQPTGDEGKAPGALVVETVFLVTDNGYERHRPFFLYDDQGRFLTHYPNDRMSPVSLAAGRYVVVSGVMTANKRVQVVIRNGMTTHVRLEDFKSAPEAP